MTVNKIHIKYVTKVTHGHNNIQCHQGKGVYL